MGREHAQVVLKMTKTSIIDLFTRHKVAANLVMIMMILSGLWASARINTQLDPSVEWPVIIVNASWPGASAEDVEQLIVVRRGPGQGD